jgi:hypothetical protein
VFLRSDISPQGWVVHGCGGIGDRRDEDAWLNALVVEWIMSWRVAKLTAETISNWPLEDCGSLHTTGTVIFFLHGTFLKIFSKEFFFVVALRQLAH